MKVSEPVLNIIFNDSMLSHCSKVLVQSRQRHVGNWELGIRNRYVVPGSIPSSGTTIIGKAAAATAIIPSSHLNKYLHKPDVESFQRFELDTKVDGGDYHLLQGDNLLHFSWRPRVQGGTRHRNSSKRRATLCRSRSDYED